MSGHVPISLRKACGRRGGRQPSPIRTLPPKDRDGILNLFRAVYRMEKRDGPLTDIDGDAELVGLAAGVIIAGYRSRWLVTKFLHSIAAPAAQGATVLACQFLALLSDSATDRAAKKEGLVYSRTLHNGTIRTAFLGLPGPSIGHCSA